MYFFVILVIFLMFLYKANKDYHILAFFAPRIKMFDGSPIENIALTLPGKTIFGNTFDMVGLNFVDIFNKFRDNALKMKNSYIMYHAGQTFLNVIDAELAEIVLNDARLLAKGNWYKFLKPSLGDGMLLSSGPKWHLRRKMLTPAFHFNILGQFQEIFKEQSEKFVNELKNMNTDVLVLNNIMPKFALNVVCETAMGVRLDESSNYEKYHESIEVIEKCFNKRILNPLLMIDGVYKMFEDQGTRKSIQNFNDFSGNVIKTRRKIFAQNLDELDIERDKENDEIEFKKQRYAMLDTLLLAEREQLIDQRGLCDEVNNFIYAGFDTTSILSTFSLMNLSLYAEKQERCYQEILEHMPDKDKCDVVSLNSLKYLECFIKENMRNHTMVPSIMRVTDNTIQLSNGLILPANSSVCIHLYDLCHNPKYFEKPFEFKPERFLPENSIGRHPYAFLPFSAGQRNCIGQKFAMLNAKIFLVYILRNFQILPLIDRNDLEFQMGITLRTVNEIKVKLVKRVN